MSYLVDSDHIIDMLDDVPEIVQKLTDLAKDGLSVSVISYLEAYQGAASDPQPDQAIRKLDGFVGGTLLLPVTPAIARRCALLRKHLAAQGKRIRPRAFDLLIAATALEHDLTLVTHNIKDYNDIPRLKLYNQA